MNEKALSESSVSNSNRHPAMKRLKSGNKGNQLKRHAHLPNFSGFGVFFSSLLAGFAGIPFRENVDDQFKIQYFTVVLSLPSW